MASGLRSLSADPVEPVEWHSCPAGEDELWVVTSPAAEPLVPPESRCLDERARVAAEEVDSQPGDLDEP